MTAPSRHPSAAGEPAARPRAVRVVACGRDRVFLADHVRRIEVGVLPEEYGVLQRVRFDVALEVDTPPGGRGEDDAERPAVSYDLIVGAIGDLTDGRRTGLLETLAERLAARLLGHPAVARATVRIEKLDRLGGHGALGVEIVRERAPQ